MVGIRGVALSAVARAARLAFNPLALFSAGEQGVWYDPSDMSTMFQDAAGTTPVTAVEQPVGLILDKSKGLVLGPELVTNGDFSNGTTGWAPTPASPTPLLEVISGELKVTIGAVSGAQQIITTVAGKRYVVSGDLRNGTATDVRLRAVDSTVSGTVLAESVAVTGATATKVTLTFIASTTTTVIYLRINGGTSFGFFDNISIRELPGFHATQTTATSRPVLSARVNLLTATEALATQTVATRATTQTLRFEGAGTVTLSGTATGTYSAGAHSVTTTAGNLTLTVSGTVTKADLRAANDALNQPAYQRVNTATDYDTTGFKPYLRFDGTDDWLVTPSIDFTGTDKMTVFAGVRKLSDAEGMLFEASTNNNNARVIYSYIGQKIVVGESGDSSNTAHEVQSSAYVGQVTKTISASIDRNGTTSSATFTRLGINGVDDRNSYSFFINSTGNYGNYPMYIGRRGGTSVPFNGRLYSLIVRGAQSTAQQIASAEAWVNQRTGAY